MGAERSHVGISSPDSALRLSVVRTNGERLEIASLRGSPVLLVVFTTYDGVSQALLTPLRQIAEAHPDLPIVGIAAQPDAASLVPLWEQALAPPLITTFDPHGDLVAGRSALGEIEAVPLLVLLDRNGVVVARRLGFASRNEIASMLARVPHR